jgi:hypothetical protein
MLRGLLPQTAALHVLCLQLLVPGRLLPQAHAVHAVSCDLLVCGRLLPQAPAMRALSADFVQAQLRRMRLREIECICKSLCSRHTPCAV